MTAKGVRSGFTLVELMVAILLLIVLASLALAIIPSIDQSQNTTRAAIQVQQWIEIAKQNAAKAHAPRGIRFLAGQANAQGVVNPQQITQLAYIELPDPYTLHGVNPASLMIKPSIASATQTGVTFTQNTKTLTANFGGANQPVQAGDYLQLGGSVYQISSVNGANQLLLTFPGVPVALQSANYQIIRQPRPTAGEELLEMAQNVIIDLKPRGLGYDLPIAPPKPLDIMFAPDGHVIPCIGNNSYNLTSFDKIIFWVRDITVPDGQGDPTLVVVYPRTGLIASQPVDVANMTTSPYTFTTTGQRSTD